MPHDQGSVPKRFSTDMLHTYGAASQAALSAVARQLDERPRETLRYQTPAEKSQT